MIRQASGGRCDLSHRAGKQFGEITIPQLGRWSLTSEAGDARLELIQ